MPMSLVDDNDEEEAAPETPVARVKGATAASGQKLRHTTRVLRDFTLEETDRHKQNCKLGKRNKCGQCRYWDLMAKDHGRFAMLKLHTPQLAFKFRKLEVLAKLPWLALKHDNGKGGAWVGCVACHAYAQERPHKVQANPYADFSIGATKLGKAHVLLRHAKTQLHLQAVAAMLDVPCGAH